MENEKKSEGAFLGLVIIIIILIIGGIYIWRTEYKSLIKRNTPVVIPNSSSVK
jgi:uncharacterized protein YneF (UPF0154 family)